MRGQRRDGAHIRTQRLTATAALACIGTQCGDPAAKPSGPEREAERREQRERAAQPAGHRAQVLSAPGHHQDRQRGHEGELWFSKR
jgi:hypothetical protein